MGEVETSTSKAYDAMHKPSKKAIAVLTPGSWKARYLAQLHKEGISEEDALEYYNDVEFGTPHAVYDLNDNPEEVATEDVTYGY